MMIDFNDYSLNFDFVSEKKSFFKYIGEYLKKFSETDDLYYAIHAMNALDNFVEDIHNHNVAIKQAGSERSEERL